MRAGGTRVQVQVMEGHCAQCRRRKAVETAVVTITALFSPGPSVATQSAEKTILAPGSEARICIYLLADARWCGERVRRGLAHGVV